MRRNILFITCLLMLLAIPVAVAAVPIGEQNVTATPADMNGQVTENQTEEMVENATGNMTVAEIIGDFENLSTLAAAIEAANLTEALSAEGPYTVFAPNNEAFDLLGNETLDELLNDTGELERILLYHVVEGNYTAGDLMNMTEENETAVQNVTQEGNVTGNVTQEGNVTGNVTDGITQEGNMTAVLQTLLGEEIEINQTDGMLMVENATIVVSDIQASNGVIHIIDAVLLPENVTEEPDNVTVEESIVDVVAANATLSMLSSSIDNANLTEALSGTGPFTLFAPNNDAFGNMSAEDLSALLNNPERLASVLQYHVVEGEYSSEVLAGTPETELQTLLGEPLKISVDENETGVMVNGARVISPDIEADNGVVHIIDEVLTPPENVTEAPTPAVNETAPDNQTEVPAGNQTGL